jgi:hypothetical protein
MRGHNALGRFDAEYEVKSIRKGITRELEKPVGQYIDWYLFDSEASESDPIYDVGESSGGRVWKDPIRVPIVNGFIYQDDQYQNDRGFYTVDTLRVIINFDDVIRYLPGLDSAPDQHLLDRIEFRGSMYIPSRVFPKGQVGYEYMGLLVEALQIKPEEQVNDVYGT